MTRYTILALAGLALTATPALAQHEQHGQAAKPEGHADMMKHMVCEMGMLPHPGMGAMMGMQQGQGMQGMQHGQPGQGMERGQPGAAGQGMQGMQGMMGGMDHTRTAHMLMEHGDDMGLALTAEQKAKMGALAEAASAACGTHYDAAKTSHHAALQALEKGDLDEYEDKLEDAMEHIVQAHLPVIRSGVEAKALLTPQQRDAASGQASGKRQHSPN